MDHDEGSIPINGAGASDPRARRGSRATLSSLQEIHRIQTSVNRDVLHADVEHTKSWSGLEWTRIVIQMLWPDVVLKHLNWPSFKIVLRSWLMMWSLTLLSICGGTAEFMGPSSFLADFSAGIEISGNLSVSAAFIYCMADILSVMFACCVSVVTHGINWRIRGYPSEAEVLQQLLNDGMCQELANPAFHDCIEPRMQQGDFLDIKTTVVTVFGMLFSFTLCGYFQSISKYGKLAWLLNALYTIIVFPFNNMMPLWKPWHFARNCVVPMGMAFAARFFVSLVVLPFSSNYKVVSSLAVACRKLKAICEKMQALSRHTLPSQAEFSKNFKFISTETQTVYTSFIVNEVDMEMVNNVEVWFSHFEKLDLSELVSQTRLIMSALSSFHFFYDAMADRHSYLKYTSAGQPGDSSPFIKKYRTPETLRKHHLTPRFVVSRLTHSWKETGRYELKQKARYQQMLRAEPLGTSFGSNSKSNSFCETPDESQGADSSAEKGNDFGSTPRSLDMEFARIIEDYEPLIRSTYELLESISNWLQQACQIVPWLIWFQRKERHRSLQQRHEEICQNLFKQAEEINKVRQNITPSEKDVALYAFVCLHFARRVKRLARWCMTIQNDRPSPILVSPLERVSRPVVPDIEADDIEYDGYHDNIGGALDQTYTSFKPLSQVQARNPDSTPPRSVAHLLGLAVLKARNCFYDPDLLFCIKRAVLTTTTLTLYFCRPTCHLAYRHWFLWVAVLTAYTVARQAVDGIYGLVAKFVVNFCGCLLGMVAWYISAGSGHGNPYGYATVTAFVWLYICFQRQFNNHFIPATSVVFSCTVTLVLGNSWNGGHVALPGVELGRGFEVAWIRFVTVTIGITVSFIGTIFPYAYTAKKAVRKIIGACIEHEGDLFSSISNFGLQRFKLPSTHIIAHTDGVTRAARAIITNLNSASTLRKRIVYEPPLAGIYPTQRYKLLIEYVYEITLLYSLTYSYFDELEDTSKIPHLLQILGWTDPRLSTGVYSILYMTCRALADGKALPSVTPGNLVEQYLFGILNRNGIRPNGEPMDEAVPKDAAVITAVALSSLIYERLDGVVLLMKELVGEVYDVNVGLFDLDPEKQTFLF